MLFAGSNIATTLRLLSSLNIKVFDYHTFFSHQRTYLQPAILKLWREDQERLIQRLILEGIFDDLMSDGRTDSPGHTGAQHLYTLILKRLGLIVHMELVQVSSYGLNTLSQEINIHLVMFRLNLY